MGALGAAGRPAGLVVHIDVSRVARPLHNTGRKGLGHARLDILRTTNKSPRLRLGKAIFCQKLEYNPTLFRQVPKVRELKN